MQESEEDFTRLRWGVRQREGVRGLFEWPVLEKAQKESQKRCGFVVERRHEKWIPQAHVDDKRCLRLLYV